MGKHLPFTSSLWISGPIFLPFGVRRDEGQLLRPKCHRNETPSKRTLQENGTSAGIWWFARRPRLTRVMCFLRRRAPISTTAGRASPSALSRLCTTRRLSSWSTTPEPSTRTARFVSRNAHVSPVTVSLLQQHPTRTDAFIIESIIPDYCLNSCQLKQHLSPVKSDT